MNIYKRNYRPSNEVTFCAVTFPSNQCSVVDPDPDPGSTFFYWIRIRMRIQAWIQIRFFGNFLEEDFPYSDVGIENPPLV